MRCFPFNAYVCKKQTRRFKTLTLMFGRAIFKHLGRTILSDLLRMDHILIV